MKSSFIQPEKSNTTVLVSDNQIARLEADDIRTESTAPQSVDSQSENSREIIDMASPNFKEETFSIRRKTTFKVHKSFKQKKNSQKNLEKLTLQICLK